MSGSPVAVPSLTLVKKKQSCSVCGDFFFSPHLQALCGGCAYNSRRWNNDDDPEGWVIVKEAR